MEEAQRNSHFFIILEPWDKSSDSWFTKLRPGLTNKYAHLNDFRLVFYLFVDEIDDDDE
jgi:hypothetical protein